MSIPSLSFSFSIYDCSLVSDKALQSGLDLMCVDPRHCPLLMDLFRVSPLNMIVDGQLDSAYFTSSLLSSCPAMVICG